MRTMRIRFYAWKNYNNMNMCVSLLVELLTAKSLAFYEPSAELFATISCV